MNICKSDIMRCAEPSAYHRSLPARGCVPSHAPYIDATNKGSPSAGSTLAIARVPGRLTAHSLQPAPHAGLPSTHSTSTRSDSFTTAAFQGRFAPAVRQADGSTATPSGKDAVGSGASCRSAMSASRASTSPQRARRPAMFHEIIFNKLDTSRGSLGLSPALQRRVIR